MPNKSERFITANSSQLLQIPCLLSIGFCLFNVYLHLLMRLVLNDSILHDYTHIICIGMRNARGILYALDGIDALRGFPGTLRDPVHSLLGSGPPVIARDKPLHNGARWRGQRGGFADLHRLTSAGLTTEVQDLCHFLSR